MLWWLSGGCDEFGHACSKHRLDIVSDNTLGTCALLRRFTVRSVENKGNEHMRRRFESMVTEAALAGVRRCM